MGQDFNGLETENMHGELKDAITQLGIEYRLMTPFTSFVAVEEMVVTDGGQPRRIDVPLESPAGVNMAGAATFRDIGNFGFIGQFFVGRRRANGGYIANSGTGRGSFVLLDSAASGSAGRLPASVNTAPVVSSVTASDPKPVTEADALKAEEDRRVQVNRKMHRAVLAVVEHVREKEALTNADEAGFIRNGKAEVQVWLSEKSDANLAKLEELGFEVILDAESRRLIVGRVSIEKLEALAELTFVSYVSPQVSK
jgi:hypothetical protein